MPLHRQNTINGSRCLKAFAALLVAIFMAAASSPAHAQGGTSRYVYDNKGRLHAVVAPNGEANVYEYDAAGNITAIRRNTASTLEVLGFSPRQGVPGNQVTIVGTGFGAGVSAVAFNGVTAQIVSVNAPVVIATVPNGATTGPISVTTPGGTATTAAPFTVRGISVMPANETVLSGQTIQFVATVVLAGDQSVIWSVEGIEGGNSIVGTITPTGLYTAPALLITQTSATFRVRVASVAAPALVADAQVRVLNPDNGLGSLWTSVTVRLLPPTGALPASPISAGVTVRQLPSTGASPAAAISAGVTVTTGPQVSTVSPGNFTRGANAAITVVGTNLGGATAIKFIDGSGAVDPNITFTGLSVNGGGTSLTANVTVGASAALGQRIVVVLSPNSHSQTSNTGTNTIQVVQ